MRHRKQHRAVESGQSRTLTAVSGDPARNPEAGDQYIGPSGRIWTVESIVGRGSRFVLTRPTDDGVAAAVVDRVALNQMIRLVSAPAVAPAIGISVARPRPRLAAPAFSHVVRDSGSHRGCHRRRVVVHLRFDEAHHAHLDTYESLPLSS